MKWFLSFIVIAAVAVVPALAQEKTSLPAEAQGTSVKIIKQGSEPRYLLKNRLTPGRYLEVRDSKSQAKGVGEAEPFSKHEMTMTAVISISKPDKDGVIEEIIKVQSLKSKSDISGQPVFSMTREQAEKEKQLEKTAASQPAEGKAGQSSREFGIKLLLSTKIIKIGPDGQVLSVTVLDDKLKETDDEKLSKPRKKGFINSDRPAKPVGIGAEWILGGQGEISQVEKYESETKAELVSVEQTDQGKAAVVKMTMTTPKCS